MEHASSLQAVALRITKLGADSAPLVGAKNAFATSQFTRVAFTPEYETGVELIQPGADGSNCVYYKAPDTLKKVTLSVAICNPQPELYEMLADGSLLADAATPANNVGWASPLTGQIPNPDGIGIEVWTRRIIGGRPSATAPYWRYVFPFAQLRMDGERAMENGIMAHTFSGDGFGNASFGDGPVGDWTFPTASPVQFAGDTTAPTGVNDYVAVVADV